MHYMDPKSTQAIKDFLSTSTKAKFAKTQPPKPSAPTKILPVRGMNPSNEDPKPAGPQRQNKTFPLRPITARSSK